VALARTFSREKVPIRLARSLAFPDEFPHEQRDEGNSDNGKQIKVAGGEPRSKERSHGPVL
jgi:hypothetical protein